MKNDSPDSVAGKSFFILADMVNAIGSGDGNLLFALPDQKSDSLYPGTPKHIIVIPGVEYFRPAQIDDFIGFVSFPLS